MDKINLAHWNDYFGNTQQSLLYAGDRYTEALFRFSEKGRPAGQVKTLATPGLTLVELDLQTAEPFQLSDTQGEEGAESLFVLQGNVESRFDAFDQPLVFHRNHQSIQYNPRFSGIHLIRPGRFHALTISYDISYLAGLLSSGCSGPLQELGERIRKKQSFLAAPHALDVSGRISAVIHAMQQCPFAGATRYVFLESKMMELFVLQMEQLQRLQQKRPEEKWNRIDMERLHAVREYIDNAYLGSFTLRDLALRFGLNEFKLKKGYRELFQTTVFGHVHLLRMQKARALLSEKEMNVSETAFHIGYDNVSSFSTAFKKRFGYSPGRIDQ